MSAASVELAPLEIRKDTSAQALSVVRYGSTDVFFLDQNAFVEPEGFWVQGGRTAEVALAAGAGRASITLMLRNGSAPNTVRVQSGSEEQTITMQPNEERSLAVAVQAADGIVRLRISSDSGFRPSDLPTGDRRYLGVWTANCIGQFSNPVIQQRLSNSEELLNKLPDYQIAKSLNFSSAPPRRTTDPGIWCRRCRSRC